MLPVRARLRQAPEFRRTVRRGPGRGRGARGALVVHVALADSAASPPAGASPRVGLVVPRALGGAVQRNATKRRLRHLIAGHLAELPAGASVVIRALPAAGEASSAHLAVDLAAALRRAVSSAETAAPSPRRHQAPPGSS